MSVNNGFVDFFVTNPSNDTIYQNLKTSFDSFNFTANENGTYQMHFVNMYQSVDVNVTLSYSVNFFVTVTTVIHVLTSSTQITSGSSIITQVQHPYLDLVVSPSSGFPVLGKSWQLFVYYKTNVTNGVTYYSSLPNATIDVTIVVDNQKKVYSIACNEAGQLDFPFLAEYSDISFQAVSRGNMSDIIAFTQQSEHYVQTDLVGLMFNISIVLCGITVSSEVIMGYFRKRIRVFFNLLIGAIFCFSVFLLVISEYTQVSLWTPWGYPSIVFGFVTWTSLGYASIAATIIFVILIVLAYLLRLRSPKQPIVPLK
jgi:hypothetical protein